MQINRAQATEMLRHALPSKPIPDALILLLKMPETVKVGDTPFLTLHGAKADEKTGIANDPFYSGGVPDWLKSDPWYVNIRSTGQQTYFTFIDKRDGKNISVKVLVASELEGAMEKPPAWKDAVEKIMK